MFVNKTRKFKTTKILTIQKSTVATWSKFMAAVLANSAFTVTAMAADPTKGVSHPSASMPAESATTDVSAQEQGSSQADVNLTQTIRRHLTKERGLSTEARNILIVTKDKTVRLQGPVANRTEATRIAKIAHRFAGDRKIINNLVVK